MFRSLCRIFDIKQHNGFKTWNNTAKIRSCPDTVERHFKSEMHKDELEEFKFELIDINKKYQLLKENLTDNKTKRNCF